MNDQELKKYWKTLKDLSGDVICVEPERKRLLDTIKYPDSLFRFRSVSENSLNALQENKMYFSSASYYDDPFDSFIQLDIKRLKRDYNVIKENPKKLFEILNKAYPNLQINDLDINNIQLDLSLLNQDVNKLREKIQQKLYSICFCESFDNEVLWLKYAENHRGFVLEYSLLDDFKEKIWNNKYVSNILPIYYSNEKYDAYNYAVYCLSLSIIQSNNYDGFEFYESALFQNVCWENTKISVIKKDCHKYDREWRLVPNCTIQDRKSIIRLPKSVTIGLKTPEYKKQLIISAAKVAKISEFYQMAIDEDDKLVRVPLNVQNQN